MRSVVGLCSSELAGTSSSSLASFRGSEHPRGIILPISDAHAYPSGAHYHHNTATTNDGGSRRRIVLFGNNNKKKHKHKHVSLTRQELVACCRLGVQDSAGASSSPRFASSSQQNVGARPFHIALGQGEKLGQCIQRSLEGLNSWITGGGGRGRGDGDGAGRGDGGGGGDNGGDSWGDEGGDMDRVPETDKTAIECSGHGKEDGEDEEEAQELSLEERLCEKQEEERLEEGRFEQERLELRDMDSEREYACRGIEVVDMEGSFLEEDPAPYEVLGITVGDQYRKVDLEDALSRLLSTGWYEIANMRWVAHSGGDIKLIVTVKDAMYSEVSSFQCINISPELITGAIPETTRLRKRIVSPPCLLPGCIQQEIMTMLQKCKEVSKGTLYEIQERIENWYHKKGYTYAKVKGFQNSEAGVLECHVDEGVITEVSVSCEDDWQQPTHCNTSTDIILERLPFAVRRGMQYNEGAAKAALNRVEQLGLFDKVHVLAAPDPECVDRECILLHILAKERALYSASVNTEWSFLCNDAGRPTLRTLQPGGSLSVQRGNINGQNRTISGSIATSNLQCPEEDLRFNLKYEHPHVTGLHNLHKCMLRVGAFNKRKLTATFSDPENQVQIPAVWIDRAGVKASLTEKLSRQSKLSYGVIIEEVATRDVAGTICNQRRNRRSIKSNSTLVSTGVDHLAFLQMKITRSNLQPGETGLVGARDIFQVDQGLGLGTHAPMFNRHQLSMTRYVPIPKHPLPNGQLPTVIVLHSRYSGCVGDVPSYRTFTNGGPYALRGHNTGELPGNSRFIEFAGEVRVPVQQMEAYGFFESLTNLQRFEAVWNNPRSLAGRIRKGIMYGAGMKMGNVRIEYVIDCSDQTGSLKVYSGERY